MKLFYSPASPYVRKVLVVAHETDQFKDIELLDCAANPINKDASIAAYNPTGKVPVMILDNGKALYDSRIICHYLDTLHQGTQLYPTTGSDRWEVLRREALADGLLDAALLARYETVLRPEQYQWQDWSDAQMNKISGSVDQMQQDLGSFAGFDAGQIASACALGYLDFRFPDYDWRTSHPALTEWFATFSKHPSMVSTLPAG